MNLLRFERQKIADIREMLLEFTLIQLKESVKSMEILTAMYNDVAAIDENMDVQVRKNKNIFLLFIWNGFCGIFNDKLEFILKIVAF